MPLLRKGPALKRLSSCLIIFYRRSPFSKTLRRFFQVSRLRWYHIFASDLLEVFVLYLNFNLGRFTKAVVSHDVVGLAVLQNDFSPVANMIIFSFHLVKYFSLPFAKELLGS